MEDLLGLHAGAASPQAKQGGHPWLQVRWEAKFSPCPSLSQQETLIAKGRLGRKLLAACLGPPLTICHLECYKGRKARYKSNKNVLGKCQKKGTFVRVSEVAVTSRPSILHICRRTDQRK